MHKDPSERITSLEHQIRNLKVIAVLAFVLFAVAVGLLLNFKVEAQSGDRILRVRGIVVEDAAGRERILIGAPIPAAQNRVRTDLARVRSEWAGRYPNADRYINYYKDYQHGANGILILDEKGFDRIALGDPAPDPNIGKRIAPDTGIVITEAFRWLRAAYEEAQTK